MTRPVPTVADLTARLAELIDDIGELVRCESPSHDLAACAESAGIVGAMGRRLLGCDPEVLEVDGRTHLRWRLGDPGARRVLLLGHHDTVWPLGSLADHPWTVTDTADGPVLRGPGCFDMKAGIVQAFHAVHGLGPDPAVTVLITGDEEVGSPTSRPLIEQAARESVAAFVLEASADGGAVKTARKGASMYRLDFSGRAAHAGLEPERGANAGIELAHQVLRIAALDDPAAGTSVTPTRSSAGTTTNTVPAAAALDVDVRAWSAQAQRDTDTRIRDVMTTVDGVRVTVTGGINRPPFETSASDDLVVTARRLYRDLGLGELPDAAVGGASDGNFTAGVGTPTLDGLGAVGGGAHADTEHVLAAALPGRTALLAALVAEVLR